MEKGEKWGMIKKQRCDCYLPFSNFPLSPKKGLHVFMNAEIE
jgi:hypothetical protein